MSKKRKKNQIPDVDLRIEAIHAAANVMAGLEYTPGTLWSLCVFFERYLLVGANGTMKQFGPKKAKKAKVLKLVQPNG